MPSRMRPSVLPASGGASRAARWLAAAALAALPLFAAAQEAFPSRPVRLIVPVAAGGGIDTAFRAIAPAWSEQLGQQVVVENKPGGGQVLGSDLVAKAKPDGYTLLAAGVPIAFNTALGRKLPYDALRDFTPLSLVVSQPLLIVVNPAVPAKSMAELVAYAKAQAKPLQYTTGGIGSYGHLWWEMFRSRQQIAGEHIAYNGIAPALKDVMGGQVPLLIDAIVPSGAQVQAGTVRGIAIVAAQRAKSLPALPTLSEQGFTGFDAAPFYGVLGPAGMDAAVVQKLNASLTKALATQAVREKLQELGFDVIGSTPDVYAKLIRDEIDRWSKVVNEQNIKVE
jgi:tripartite-type tricarboxylate transporter receptor subunit TctC